MQNSNLILKITSKSLMFIKEDPMFAALYTILGAAVLLSSAWAIDSVIVLRDFSKPEAAIQLSNVKIIGSSIDNLPSEHKGADKSTGPTIGPNYVSVTPYHVKTDHGDMDVQNFDTLQRLRIGSRYNLETADKKGQIFSSRKIVAANLAP